MRLGVNDELMKYQHRSGDDCELNVWREDLAWLVVESVKHPELTANTSFDLDMRKGKLRKSDDGFEKLFVDTFGVGVSPVTDYSKPKSKILGNLDIAA